MLLGLGLGWGCRGMGSCRAPCRPKVYQFPLSPYTAHLQLQETTCSHFGHSRIPAELLYTWCWYWIKCYVYWELSKRNRCKKRSVLFFQTPKLACACFGEKHLVMEKMVHYNWSDVFFFLLLLTFLLIPSAAVGWSLRYAWMMSKGKGQT